MNSPKAVTFEVPNKGEIKKIANASYLKKRDLSAADPKNQQALRAFIQPVKSGNQGTRKAG